jgi:hypothetical protein
MQVEDIAHLPLFELRQFLPAMFLEEQDLQFEQVSSELSYLV